MRRTQPIPPFILVALAAVTAALAGCASPSGQGARARNVILFLGDAGGIPTLSAASIHGYGEPRRLFIHGMPNIALAETTAASDWVTDSAAGMTAIVTGQKTNNGVVSQSSAAIRRKRDGEPLKTILEYAEERGSRPASSPIAPFSRRRRRPATPT